jgi:prepilin-type processing-associated H-X9-DG protein
LILLATVVLLFIWVLPLLAQGKARTEWMTCFNNLRVLGQAVHVWGDDHKGNVPWRTLRSEGGTMPDSGTKPGVAWIEWMSFSNHLDSPAFLVCPSDKNRKIALTWDLEERGLFNSNFRDNAVSYFAGMEAFANAPRGLVAGDRNIRYLGFGGSCSARVNNIFTIHERSTESSARWTNSIHGVYGNLLFHDGSVERHSSETMGETLSKSPTTYGYNQGRIHTIAPY